MSPAFDLRAATRVNSPEPFAALPRPAAAAHVIASDAEAIAVAERLAAQFATGAALRDREALVPIDEVEAYSQSGLWNMRVPKRYGGAEVSYVTVTEVFKIISAADPSLGQIPQNHVAVVEHIALDGTEAQKRELFEGALRGVRFGNATSETGGRHVGDLKTSFVEDGDDVIVNGTKFYSTGALVAHVVPVAAVDKDGRVSIVFADRNAPGLEVVNDWSSFGQRTTGSGSTLFDEISVTPFQVVPHQDVFDRPTTMGPVAQLIHAAVDVGIARGALAETLRFTRQHARPFFETKYEHGWEDPHLIAASGDLVIRVNAANALLRRAARITDVAQAAPTAESVAAASIAVAEAKALATDVSVHVSSKLFELTGSRSTLEQYGLDRYWRNARVHTLHDPVRYKYVNVANYYLNGVLPPRHGAI